MLFSAPAFEADPSVDPLQSNGGKSAEAIEYGFEMAMDDVDEYMMMGRLDVLINIVQNSSVIALKTSKLIRHINVEKISVWSCEGKLEIYLYVCWLKTKYPLFFTNTIN